MIKIYNTLSRRKEEFIPLNPPEVKMYTCGVTVYDECHIGHARSLYIFDVIRRYLKYRGYEVNFVRNITDIDDKIINRANELKMDWQELVKKYIDRYYEDLSALSIEKADYEPRATESIADMLKYIASLIDSGYAYEAEGDVYFNVRKFPEYGKLSGQNIAQIQAGARIEPSNSKKDPLDFVLWKRSKENEPSWDSPYGKGRPGWHIECSVMSQKFLKTDTLDIHAGGLDLVFPHHENEIAQAEALSGKPFAKYWLHHGLLTINGQKMAKSLGNFITIKDFIAKYQDADILKLFFLSTHYSHPIDYTVEKVRDAQRQRIVFNSFFEQLDSWQPRKGNKKTPISIQDIKTTETICGKFLEAMDDDFNTSRALGYLFELMNLGLAFISADKEDGFRFLRSKLEPFFQIFGLKSHSRPVPANIELKRHERDEARVKKDFRKSDEIRSELRKDYHYIINDTAGGTTLYFIEED